MKAMNLHFVGKCVKSATGTVTSPTTPVTTRAS